MKTKHKMAFGALLSICGGIGIVLGPSFGLADLGRPWSFIIGFAVGVSGGIGAVLAICGLIENRKLRQSKED
jgi:hypothetical protein